MKRFMYLKHASQEMDEVEMKVKRLKADKQIKKKKLMNKHQHKLGGHFLLDRFHAALSRE